MCTLANRVDDRQAPVEERSSPVERQEQNEHYAAEALAGIPSERWHDIVKTALAMQLTLQRRQTAKQTECKYF